MFPDVRALIPHRPPQLLVSRVIAVDGLRVEAEHDYLPADLPGHFPEQAVVPGVWLIEGLAQTLACLGRLSGETGRAVLTGVEKARFRGMVLPPVTVRYAVELVDRRFGLATARGVVRVGEKVVCTAEIKAALLPADTPAAEPG